MQGSMLGESNRKMEMVILHELDNGEVWGAYCMLFSL